jgi:riboflavin synthase
MFTGIIEAIGTVQDVSQSGDNRSFWIKSTISPELKVDQSISHNGVCLTVEAVGDGIHKVTAINETLEKTNLGAWKTGDKINLERCLPANGRLDGHMVQGHVDGLATCISKKNENGSWLFSFEFDEKFAPLIIEKGSICVNGISLTAFNLGRTRFSVAIIPYTFEHTNMYLLEAGQTVNLEFDVLGKYFLRWKELGFNGDV